MYVCMYTYTRWAKKGHPFNYVDIMHDKLLNTRNLYSLNNFNICYQLYRAKRAHLLETFSYFFVTLVFLHTQIVNQSLVNSTVVTQLQFIRVK